MTFRLGLLTLLTILMLVFTLSSSARARFFGRSGEPCQAIGVACAAAAEGIARQPEAETQLRAVVEEAAGAIKALGVRCERRHVAEGIGLFAAEAATGISRQPEAAGKIADLGELCGQLLRDQL